MPDYVVLDGVRTWYDELGDGDPLVLLHPGGAGVDARAFGPNVKPLAACFRVYTPERRAHGHTPDVTGPITFDAMAKDTIAFLEAVVGRRAHVVGCSDGAIVGLLVALRRPDLIDRLVLVAGVFHFEGWLPEVIDPGNGPPEFLARLYEEVSPDGAGHAARHLAGRNGPSDGPLRKSRSSPASRDLPIVQRGHPLTTRHHQTLGSRPSAQ
jgi:pimeloyl-ACP methyl ester carboxylesterase